MEPAPDESVLTAYLDSELLPQERREIENRLAKEPELRNQLVLLEKTWDCLALLEQDSPNAEQIETTLHLAAVSISKNPAAELKSYRITKYVLCTLAGLVLFAVTFQLGRWTPLNDPSYRPMVERLDWYLALSDDGIELLQELAVRRVFLPPQPKNRPPVAPHDYRPGRYRNRLGSFYSRIISLNLGGTEAMIDSPLFDKNIQRYRTLSPEKRRQIAKLHQDIENAPQSAELILTLQNYYNWRKSLQSYEKADLKRSPNLSRKVADITALKQKLDSNFVGRNFSIPAEMAGIEESGWLAEALADLLPQQQDRLLNEDPNQILSKLKQPALSRIQ